MTLVAPDPKNIVLGEGAFYFNYDETDEALVGATRGGGSFNREIELREIEFDGARGPVKGMRRKDSAVARLTLNELELHADNREKFYGGLEVDTSGMEYDVVKAKKDVEDSDYITNVAFVGETKDGRPVVIVVRNALGDGNIELALEDKNEVVPEVQFTGHYDRESLDAEPWEIRWPKENGGAV